MDIEEVKKNVEEAEKLLREITTQLQQGDPNFQNLVGQYNAWKTMLASLENAKEASNGKKAPPPPSPSPRGQKRPQNVPQEA
jgi:ABC-type ATPase involved in cell division